MKPEEFITLERAEETHWWYLGLRDFLEKMIQRHLPSPLQRVLDAGCGTGANLRLMKRLFNPGYLGGFDVSEASLASSSRKVPGADLYASSIVEPHLQSKDLDLVISMDVVYMVGLQEAMAGLKTLVSALRPGGLFILHLPAYNWLKSAHDVAVGTKERYTSNDMRVLAQELGMETLWRGYRVCLWFPMVLLARLPSMIVPAQVSSARSDLDPPPSWVNSLLAQGLFTENSLIAHGLVPPWGSSVALVMRKTLQTP